MKTVQAVHRAGCAPEVRAGGDLAGRGDHPGGTFAATPEGMRAFAERLGPLDEVALEATGNTWAIATCWPAMPGGWWCPTPRRRGRSPRRRSRPTRWTRRSWPACWRRFPAAGVAARRGDQRVAPAGVAPSPHGAAAHPVEEPGPRDPAPQPGAALPGRGLFGTRAGPGWPSSRCRRTSWPRRWRCCGSWTSTRGTPADRPGPGRVALARTWCG